MYVNAVQSYLQFLFINLLSLKLDNVHYSSIKSLAIFEEQPL